MRLLAAHSVFLILLDRFRHRGINREILPINWEIFPDWRRITPGFFTGEENR